MAPKRRKSWQRHGSRGLSLGVAALGIAVFVTAPAEAAMRRLDLGVAVPVLLALVAVGVLGDRVGVAAAAAAEPGLHAMAARHLPGARQALALKRQADRVTSIASDVVGDIAGTISGAAAAAVAVRLGAGDGLPRGLLGPVVIGAVAAITVGGKAFMKGIALEHANQILYAVGYVWYWLGRLAGRRGRGWN
jgi:CBS domain containing-hemolysin-like protein